MLEIRHCGECNIELSEDPSAERLPCPECGALNRKFLEVLQDSLVAHTGYRVKHKRPGVKRPLAEERDQLSYFVRDNEWHRRYMLVDRINDLYVEKITRVRTGEVVRHVEEKLSDHLGHGDDKRNRGAP